MVVLFPECTSVLHLVFLEIDLVKYSPRTKRFCPVPHDPKTTLCIQQKGFHFVEIAVHYHLAVAI